VRPVPSTSWDSSRSSEAALPSLSPQIHPKSFDSRGSL
jgi:hypothetical protein